MAMNFIQGIESAWQKNDSLVCIGLDPDVSKIPTHLRILETPLFNFNKASLVARGAPQKYRHISESD
jgi:orotidine-5'-phosphate decarboxylase